MAATARNQRRTFFGFRLRCRRAVIQSESPGPLLVLLLSDGSSAHQLCLVGGPCRWQVTGLVATRGHVRSRHSASSNTVSSPVEQGVVAADAGVITDSALLLWNTDGFLERFGYMGDTSRNAVLPSDNLRTEQGFRAALRRMQRFAGLPAHRTAGRRDDGR
ncbi:hypothetical protein MRX96_003661 [Rhipicephalus microplus]